MAKETKLREILAEYKIGFQVSPDIDINEHLASYEAAISDLVIEALPEEQENPIGDQYYVGYNQALRDIKANLKQRGIGE